ncbi:unnamed protein product, partial [Ostreobium quekettii]
VVYPKYEEALRLGLEAFSKTRTNKFRRQLPHILGTVEFQSDSQAPGIRSVDTFGPTAANAPRGKEVTALDSPSTAASVGTGSSDFARMAQDIVDSFQLGDPHRGRQGAAASLSANSGSITSVPETSLDEADGELAPALVVECRAHVAEVEDGFPAGGIGEGLPSPDGWGMVRQGLDAGGSPGRRAHDSMSLSENGAWHSASSGSEGPSPSVEFVGDSREGRDSLQMLGALFRQATSKLVMGSVASMATGDVPKKDRRSDSNSVGPAGSDKDAEAVAEGLLLEEAETSQGAGLTCSLSGALEEGLFDDDELKAELERLSASGTAGQASSKPTAMGDDHLTAGSFSANQDLNAALDCERVSPQPGNKGGTARKGAALSCIPEERDSPGAHLSGIDQQALGKENNY